MDLQTFFTSEKGTNLAMSLSRNLPPRVGLAVVRLAASLVTRRRQSPLVRHIRLNQSVVRGLPQQAPELDGAVRRVLLNAGRGYYETYHRLALGEEAIREAITFSAEFIARLKTIQAEGRGVIVLGAHVGNFDLGMLGFAAHGFVVQAVTYALPPGGYQLQNKMRTEAGYIVTPADGPAVKTALKRLRAGGIILTGIDRVLPEAATPIQFFGLPAFMPTGYVRLALSTKAIILLVRLDNRGEGKYHVVLHTDIEATSSGDRKRDTIENTEMVLAEAEEIIRARPDEWMMFHPVWPQLLER